MATTTQLPPEVLALAEAHRQRQQLLALAATRQLASLWGYLDPADLAGSWPQIASQVQRTVTAAMLEASRGAQDYVSTAVKMWGAEPDPAGRVAEWTFASTASDGRSLGTLLERPVLDAQAFLDDAVRRFDAQTADLSTARVEAKALGRRHMDRVVATQVADSARVATGVAQVNDRAVKGYVRMLTPPSCSRCVVLAGRWYRWNAGFARHP